MDDTITPQPAASARVLGFDDMGLRVGLALTMRARDPALAQTRHQVDYIGALRGKSFLITLPILHDKGLWMQSGQDYVFHVIEGMYVYAFTSRVLRARNSPFPYVHFSYPDKIEARQIRKSYRVQMRLPLNLAGGDGSCLNALLLNLSMTGALLEAPAHAWQPNETLILALPVTLEEARCELALHATVRSRADKGQRAYYGLEFASLAQHDALLLHYFIDHTLALSARD